MDPGLNVSGDPGSLRDRGRIFFNVTKFDQIRIVK
jgi:hypothetical protein